MELDLLREAVTLLSLAAFVGICCWAWSGRHKARFEEAARAPLAEDGRPPEGASCPSEGRRAQPRVHP